MEEEEEGKKGTRWEWKRMGRGERRINGGEDEEGEVLTVEEKEEKGIGGIEKEGKS